jgi:hypothetical protein
MGGATENHYKPSQGENEAEKGNDVPVLTLSEYMLSGQEPQNPSQLAHLNPGLGGELRESKACIARRLEMISDLGLSDDSETSQLI